MVERNKQVSIHAMNQNIRNDSKARVKSEIGENDSDLNPYHGNSEQKIQGRH